MMHGYPFAIVEHKGMRRVFEYLNENVQTISRNSIKKVCLAKHLEFKVMLKEMFSTLPGKVCLTCDIWTACTSCSYLTLTIHYVDDGWSLRSKVLNFFHFAPPHTGLEIYNTLYEKSKEWGLANKVLTMTCDNASNMDNMVSHLRSSLLENLPCDGKFFHEGLDNIQASLKKIRDTVRYIDAFEARLINFYACAQQCGLACNTKLWLDVSTRWNSTYLMLKKALYYRRGLDLYGSKESYFQHCLSSLEWLKVEKICELLEPFYEITTLFSGSDYLTSILYFYNIWDIESLLLSAKDDVDVDISAMATKMYAKFDKYWREYSLVMSFGVILDPRYKFDFVKFALKKLHGDDIMRANSHPIKVRQELLQLLASPSYTLDLDVPVDTGKCTQLDVPSVYGEKCDSLSFLACSIVSGVICQILFRKSISKEVFLLKFL
ncbi:hypothetical protein RND81_05G083900 [Saponaria officinalis]|uniref:hAT-like transposase RNase-H fold domain-containing protein n=1 Tax=Saponaria officinalis TaxID=3572 RepID=A0AAW1KVQ0_SAPOF